MQNSKSKGAGIRLPFLGVHGFTALFFTRLLVEEITFFQSDCVRLFVFFCKACCCKNRKAGVCMCHRLICFLMDGKIFVVFRQDIDRFGTKRYDNS